MRQFDLRKKFIILLSFLFAASCSIVNVYGLEEPVVTVSAIRVHSTPSEIPAAMLDVEFKIYNPSDARITLHRIEYKIYVNGIHVGDRVVLPPIFEEPVSIFPNETISEEFNPTVDLSSFDEKTRKTILDGGGNWNISGTVYFSTPAGILSVPLRMTSYPLTAKIFIFVKDEKDYPIPSANITLQSESEKFNKVADELGRAEFILPCENYQLKITKEGYQPYQESLNLTKPLVIDKLIHLTASYRPILPSRIKIEVRDQTWIPIVGANVTLISKEFSFEEITNASGSVEFEVPTTNYTIRVSKEGYISHEQSLELSVPSNIMRAIQLYPSVKLTIEIKDEGEKPINDVNITLASDAGSFSEKTNASGIAEFVIPRTNYTLSVSKKGYHPHEETLDLSKFTTSTKVIELIPETKPWWEQYWYLIFGAISICVMIPIIIKLRKRFSTS